MTWSGCGRRARLPNVPTSRLGCCNRSAAYCTAYACGSSTVWDVDPVAQRVAVVVNGVLARVVDGGVPGIAAEFPVNRIAEQHGPWGVVGDKEDHIGAGGIFDRSIGKPECW